METARQTEASFGDILDGAIVVEEIDHRHEKWFKVFMPALRTFHSFYGHVDVPEDFVVPHSSSSWPRSTWGLHLGEIITRESETKRFYNAQVTASQQELEELNFTWTTTTTADRAWKYQVLPALRVFHEIYGHCNITSSFVVPEWNPWPKDTWGLSLGAIVDQVRLGRSYTDQMTRDSDVLENLGFLWDARDVEWKECILPALVTFADEIGDDEPLTCDFVVPSEAPWLKQTWGLKLGLFMTNSQRREPYFVQIVKDAHVLDDLRFEITLSDTTWERQVIPLLTIFSTLFPTQMKLPEDFVIPRKQPWPRQVWDLELGKIGTQNANRIAVTEQKWRRRSESTETRPLIAETRSQVWTMRILPALVTFVKVFGDCRLGGHFIVPSEEPWPKPTWGLRLGAAIAEYQKNGMYFDQVGRDVDCLDELGFSLKLSEIPWVQHAAPLLETYSAVYPCSIVSDDFVIPAETPWQETMWGIKLGKLVRWNAQQIFTIENKWREQVVVAVAVYRKAFGDVCIGDNFVIPCHSPWPTKTWGMDLSRILHRLQIGECYDGHSALARRSVTRLKNGIRRRRDESWEVIFTALKTFSKRFGHCIVKPHFVVPTRPSWPKTVWNLQLGEIVAKMKMHGTFFPYIGRCAKRLSKLKFVLTLSALAWKEKVAPLIALFEKLHPLDTIPYEFIIPFKDPWPENVWGVNLGVLVQWNLRRLEAIEREWRDQVVGAYQVFLYENANKVLRDKFVVPSRSPWPFQTWNRELRKILTCVQTGQHYGGHIALAKFHSNEACALYNLKNEQWKTVIFPALHMFAMVFGHCSVPEDFVVPSQSPWLKQTMGIPLGNIVASMEKRGDYFAQIGLNADRLETFGFRYKLTDAPWVKHMNPLLNLFAATYPHEILPEDFVVPAQPLWPQKLWGFKLGKLISWSSQFTWNNTKREWKRREMPYNTTMAGKYGFCKVSGNFRVPSELPWPKKMWGRRLEVYLRQMHFNGDLFISDGLARALQLEREFGFVFELPVATDVVCGAVEKDDYKAEIEQFAETSELPRNEPESNLGKRSLPDTNCERKEDWVGSYSPRSRRRRIQKFLKKRQERVWFRGVKYDVRKDFADKRLRVKGRFVASEDEKFLKELLSFT